MRLLKWNGDIKLRNIVKVIKKMGCGGRGEFWNERSVDKKLKREGWIKEV